MTAAEWGSLWRENVLQSSWHLGLAPGALGLGAVLTSVSQPIGAGVILAAVCVEIVIALLNPRRRGRVLLTSSPAFGDARTFTFTTDAVVVSSESPTATHDWSVWGSLRERDGGLFIKGRRRSVRPGLARPVWDSPPAAERFGASTRAHLSS